MKSSFFYKRVKNIHFVGIGGIGMSGIAQVLLQLGFNIQGSDISQNEMVIKLQNMGAKIAIGHNSDNIKNADVVVSSTAIDQNNPEIKFAKEHSIPIIPRAEMLAELMRFKEGIAIAGSHGKTTTTSLVSAILQHASLDPTVVIGGKVNQLKSNAMLGSGKLMVTEADESDGSFLHLTPKIATITNIDKEHLDFYQGGLEEIKNNFIQFINNLPFYGLAVLCLDSPNVIEIIPQLKRKFISYSIYQDADLRATDIKLIDGKTYFKVCYKGKLLGDISLNLVGKHNVQNALAAVAIALELGISFEHCQKALLSFLGVQRRFSVRAQHNEISVIDDYAHHPEEIKAVLGAAKQLYPKSRIVTLFQPHRFSRTKLLMDDFANCFNDSDITIISDIYPASEAKPSTALEPLLVDRIKTNNSDKEIMYSGDLQQSCKELFSRIKKGDVILTLGAGNITKSSYSIAERIQQL